MTKQKIVKNIEATANQIAFEAGLLRSGASAAAARAKIAQLFVDLEDGIRAYGIFPTQEG
jgi:hypothetical protein